MSDGEWRCLHCGAEFADRQSAFCGDACRAAWAATRDQAIAAYLGRPDSIRPGDRVRQRRFDEQMMSGEVR